MKINLEINDETIRKAVMIVLKHYKDERFLEQIKRVDSFNFTTHSPDNVATAIQVYPEHMEITITSYKPINPFSKAIAHAKDGVIYFNARKSGSVLDRVETIFHELMHLCGYQHDGNYVTEFNLKTVPYLASNIFKNYIKDLGK